MESSSQNKLKNSFTTAPILQHPDPEKCFTIEQEVGAVLSQRTGDKNKLHPVANFSMKLSPSERNHDMGNRELLAIKLALQEWRHWLEGAIYPLHIITEHKKLEYSKTTKRLNPCQARWSLLLQLLCSLPLWI